MLKFSVSVDQGMSAYLTLQEIYYRYVLDFQDNLILHSLPSHSHKPEVFNLWWIKVYFESLIKMMEPLAIKYT